MIKIKNFLLLTLIVIQWDGHRVTGADISWNDHDISTLKLLQIVHRHGERTVLENNMPKTDPFRNRTKWPDGFGQLTPKGKYRMYKIGENLRKWYKDFLDLKDQGSPREVYARSSIEHRYNTLVKYAPHCNQMISKRINKQVKFRKITLLKFEWTGV